MTLFNTHRAFLGLLTGALLGLIAVPASAQEPPAKDPGARAGQGQPPESQPAQDREDKLRRLREIQEQHRAEGAAEAASRPAPRTSRRPPPASSATQAEQPPTDKPVMPTEAEELQAKREASPGADRGAERFTPSDFVGPSPLLANAPLPEVTAPTELPEQAAGSDAAAQPTGEAALAPDAGESESSPRMTRVRRPSDTERSQWFNFVNTPWEVVIRHFVDRIGKPMMDEGDFYVGGTLTYVNDREFTKQEAIDELNLLLHEHEYLFVEREHHIYLIPLTDMSSHIALSHVYPTVKAFEEANPRDMEYVRVYYRVEGLPAQKYVDMFLDALPIYCRMRPLEESNQIEITALARDVRKFLALKDMVDISPSDPRELRFFEIKTNAQQIEQMVRSFLGIQQGPQRTLERDPRTGRMVPRVEQVESDVQMIADDRTNAIIVKATPDKIKEISELIEKFDTKPDIGKFNTVVIPVGHADAVEVANVLNEVFRQEQGDTQPDWQRIRLMQQRLQAQQGGRAVRAQPQPQPAAGTPESILAEGVFERAKKTIRITPEPRQNALFVYANDEGIQRVRDLLKDIDRPDSENFQEFVLKNATVSDVAPVLSELVSSMTVANLRTGQRSASVVPNELRNAFYVFADRTQMAQIERFITQLDVPGPESERHVVRLKNLAASQAAQLVTTLLDTAQTPRITVSRRGVPMRMGGGAGAGATTTPTFQVIPLEEAQILIVICSAEDWAKVEETLLLWDENALTNTPKLETFVISKGNAVNIADMLGSMYRSYTHPAFPRTQVLVQAEGDKVYVWGVRPALEEIAALINVLDVESPEDEVRILPLVHADASQVAQQLQQLFMRRIGAPRGGARGPSGPTIDAEPVTNSLIVQANRADLEKIMSFAQEMDEKIGAQLPEKRFFTLRFANAREVATAIQTMFGSGVVGGRRVPTASQIKAVASDMQVIVEAPQEKLTEIEVFIKQLDDPQGRDVVIKTMKLTGRDVGQIATKLSNAFRARPNVLARFDADAQAEIIVLTCYSEELPECERLIQEYAEAQIGQEMDIQFRQMNHAQAADAAPWLRDQLVTMLQAQLGRDALQLIKVTADARTNRVIINAPKVAVVTGMTLLDQYDVAPTGEVVSVMQTEVRKLAGLEVRALANSLNQIVRGWQPRPDRLTASFASDEATETLIISAPKDMFEEINKLITKFEAEALEVAPVQKFVQINNADANHVGNQLRAILSQQVRRTRGGAMADRINIVVEPRLNQLVLNMPQIVMPLAEELIEQLDQPAVGMAQLQTLGLTNADANTVYQVLRQIFDEKIRARTLQISVEPMTNSLIIGASQEDFAEIEKWAKELDEKALTANLEVKIIDLLNANPWEVYNVLNTQFAPRRGGVNRLGQDIKFSIIAGRSIVVQAPSEKMVEIEELASKLDAIGQVKVEVRTYELPGIGNNIHGLAQQIANAVNSKVEAREMRVAYSAYPQSDTMILTARPDQFTEIEQMIDKFKGVFEAEKTVTKIVQLEYLNAGQYAGQIQNMLASKLNREGRSSRALQSLQIMPDPRTNRLVCYLPEKIVPDLEDLLEQLDVPPTLDQGRVRTIVLAFADCNTVANLLQGLFGQRSSRRAGVDASQVEIRIQAEPITNALLVTASDEDFAQIEKKALEIDEGAINNQVQPVTIQPAYADVNELRQMIDTMFRQGGRNQIQDVIVTVSNGQLIVQAPKRKLDTIFELIEKVDAPNPNQMQVQMFELKVLNATQLAAAVQLFLRNQPQDRRVGSLSPGAYPEPTTNTLVVIAPGELMPMVANLIADLDSRTPKESQAQIYVLTNVRADQIANNVDTMLKAKVMEREGARKGSIQTGVFADTAGNRLVVYAPAEYQKLADELITLLDQQVDTGEIVHIIAIQDADAQQLAQTLTQIMPGGGRGAASPVRIVADVNSNSILISGLPRDVAQIEKHIAELEGRSVTVPELQRFDLLYADARDAAERLRSIYGGRPRNPLDQVTISEDTYRNQLIVVTNRRKMREVETFIAQLDAEPDVVSVLQGPREIYLVEVNRGNPADIAWEMRMLLPDGPGAPTVETDWYDQFIIVTCKPAEFPPIEKMIREFERLAKPERKIARMDLRGRDVSEVLQYLSAVKGEELSAFDVAELPPQRVTESLVEDLWPEDQAPPGVEPKPGNNRTPPPAERPATGRRAARFQTALPLSVLLLGDVEGDLLRDEPPATTQPAAPRAFGGGRLASDEPPSEPAAPAKQPPAAGDKGAPPIAEDDLGRKTVPSPYEKERGKIYFKDGRLVIEGTRDEVEKLQRIVETLDEDRSAGEVIRIFRFRWGDVTAAAEVLSIMFDVRQRQPIIIPQPQPQQRRPGQQGRDDEVPPSIVQQMQAMVGGGAGGRQQQVGTQLRIATDPGHNYLIVKCDESYLPEIRQLLRELDIPPGKTEIKIIKLRILDAAETAETIKEVLGITRAQGRRGAPAQRGGRQGVNPQQQLMEMLQSQSFSISGVEGGAKVERVEIVPNEITNSILVSAPPEVMALIERVVGELEELEGRGIIGIHYYQLQSEGARAEDILPLLQAIFDAAAGGGASRARGPRGGGAAGGLPGALGPVSVSADPRSNTIIFTCEGKDVETVERQIAMLDRSDAIAEAELYVCQFGDAVAIAEQIREIFAAGGGRRPGEQVAGLSDVRISADAATNAILVWASRDKRDLIFEKIEALDLLSEQPLREIEVRFAKAQRLADTLMQVFGGAGAAQRPGRRGGAAGGAATVGRVTIIGDNDAKKLLVRAPDESFKLITEMVRTLDVPSELLQLRRFELQYADATAIVEGVKAALAEYLQIARAQNQELNLDAFTAMPDPRTNSVVVVGTEEVFLFVGRIVDQLDVPTPPDKQKQFRVFVLELADAATVAETINAYAAGAAGGGGRRGAQALPGGMRDLNVTAVADPLTNTVMVFGRQDDIDLVQLAVIDQLQEKIAGRTEIAEIRVEHVPPSQLVSYIWQFLGESVAGTAGAGGQRGGRRSATEAAGPRIVPSDDSKLLVVRGTPRQVQEIRDLVARFDTEQFMDPTIKVIAVPTGHDAQVLATDIEQLINDSEAMRAARYGTEPRQVRIVADTRTNALILSGEPALFGMAQTVIDQLQLVRTHKPMMVIMELKKLPAEDAVNVVNQLNEQRPGGPSSGTRTTPTRRRIPTQGGTRGRGMLLPGERTIHHGRFDPNRPRDVGGPFVGTMPLLPLIALGAQEAAEPPPPPPPQDTQIKELLSGITGQLRGDVTAEVLDNRRIMIIGDEQDVAFVQQILTLLEQSKSPPAIEVFILQEAKASAIAPVVEATIRAHLQGIKSSEQFSISVEERSNAMIVSASEDIMELIASLLEQIDQEGFAVSGWTTTLVTLRNVRAVEMLQIIKPTIEKLATARAIPAQSRPQVSSDPRSNSLIIIGNEKDVKEIRELAEALDVELTEADQPFSFVRADVILIQLRNGNAADVAQVLTEMIEEQQEAARQADGERAGAPFVKVLKLRLADGRELPELNLDRPIKVIPEKGTNSLIVFSSKENNEALQAIVEVFDTLPIGADTDVKAIVLEHASAERVAQLVEELFDNKKYIRRPSEGDASGLQTGVLPPVPPGPAARGLPYPLVVQHDARSNTIVVVGRTDAVLLAVGVIRELDRPTMSLGHRAHVIPLKSIPADKLANTLKQTLDDRAQDIGGGNESRDNAVIQPEGRTNSLIVIATDEMFALIQDLVMKLDGAPKADFVDVRYRTLKIADALKLQGILEQMFEAKEQAMQRTNPDTVDTLKVIADARGNALILTGTPDFLAEAEELIAQLDQIGDNTLIFQAFRPKLNTATNITSLLQEIIDNALRQQDSALRGTPVQIVADPISDTILVAAARDDMLLIARWIEIMDRPSELQKKVAIMPLKRSRAEDLVRTVESLFQRSGQAQGVIDLVVQADTVTNALVAYGPASLLSDVREIVRQIEDADIVGGAMVRVFKLEQIDAATAGDLLTNILQLRGGTVGGRTGGAGTAAQQQTDKQVKLLFQKHHPELGLSTLSAVRSEITVIANAQSNSLVITAPAESMPLMAALVETIDVPPDTANIRIFALRNADAEKMVATLERLFERRTTTGGTAGTEVERELTIEGLGAGGREEVAFAVDVRTNSVIAAGTPGYLDIVERFVLQLDSQPIPDRETFVYEPRNIGAGDLADSLREFSESEQRRLDEIGDDVSTTVRQQRQITAIANETANRIVVDVDPRFKEAVMEIIRELDQPPPQVGIRVLILEVSMDNALDLGVEFAFQDLQWTRAGVQDTTTFDYVGGTDLGAAGSGLGGFSFTITGADFNFLFRTLQNEGNLQVLSRPQIVAMNGEEAYIDISDDVPYVTGTSTTIGGVTSTSVARERIGIRLTVTPQINPDGFVLMDLTQEVSDFTGSTVDVGPGVTAPTFFRREAKTKVSVRDNETVVIGGLITSRKENREQKVPILGDIPLLGMLFRNQSDSSRRTELLIVMTPEVIRNADEYRAFSLRERDRLNAVGPDTLGDPLLQGLRLSEDELAQRRAGVVAPPEEKPRVSPPIVDPELLYTPMRPAAKPAREPEPPAEPESYAIPRGAGMSRR